MVPNTVLESPPSFALVCDVNTTAMLPVLLPEFVLPSESKSVPTPLVARPVKVPLPLALLLAPKAEASVSTYPSTPVALLVTARLVAVKLPPWWMLPSVRVWLPLLV